MEKYLKYYNEVQIMRNGMEQVKTTNGSVAVEPSKARAGEEITVKITYTVGEDPVYIGGVLRFYKTPDPDAHFSRLYHGGYQ